MDELEQEFARAEQAVAERRKAAKDFEHELTLANEATSSGLFGDRVSDQSLSDLVTGQRHTRGYLTDIGASGLRGVVRAVKASYDAIENIAEGVVGTTGDIRLNITDPGPLFIIQSPEEARKANAGEDKVNRALGSVADAIGEPQTLPGNLTQGVTQFVTGLLGAKKWLKGWGILQQGGKAVMAANATIAGAISSGVAFEGDEKNLANLIQEAKPLGIDLENPVTEFLALNGDDSEIEGRLKNALTDAVGGVAVDGFIHGLRMIRASRRVQAAAKTDGDVVDFETTSDVEHSVNRVLDPGSHPLKPGRIEPDASVEAPVELKITDEPLTPTAATPDDDIIKAIKARADLLSLEGEEQVAKAAEGIDNVATKLDEHAEKVQAAIERSKPTPLKELSDEERYAAVRKQLGITDEKLQQIRDKITKGQIQPEELGDIIGFNPATMDLSGVKDVADMVGLLNTFARVFEDAGVKAGAGHQTIKDIAAHAAAIGGSVDEAVQLFERTRNLPAYVWAQRLAVNGSAAKLHGLARRIASGKGTPQDLLDLVVHDKRHALLQIVARGSRAEIGRALRVMREGVEVNEATMKLANGRRLREARKAKEASAAAKSAASKVKTAAAVKKAASDAKVKADDAQKKVLDMEQAVAAAREALGRAHDARMASELKKAKAAHKEAVKTAKAEAKEAEKAHLKAEAEAKKFEDGANADFDKMRDVEATLTGDLGVQFDEVDEALRGMGLKPDQVVELAKEIAKRTKSIEVNAASRTGLWAGISDRITALYINNILSGLPTMALNVSSGFYKLVESSVERYGSAMVGDRWDRVAAHKSTVAAFSSWRSAWELAGKAWTEGLPQTDLMSRAEVALRGGTGANMAEKILSAPSRAILTVDEFFKHIFYQQELTQRAVEVAAAAARLRPDAKSAQRMYDEVFKDTLANPTDDLVLDAIESARYNTFQANLESKLANNLIRLTNGTPITKLMVPFIKTPANIIKQGLLERSPLAALRKKFWQQVRAGGREGRTAVFRATVGTAAVGVVWEWANSGNITGSRVGRPGLANSADLAGPPPYSIKIAGTWYQYNRLDPMGTIFGLTADIRELYNARRDANSNDIESDDIEVSQAFAGLLGIVSENITDKTFFKGISDFVQALHAGASGQGSIISTYVNAVGTNLVPFSSMQRSMARAHDEYAREAFTFTEKLMQQTPGLSSKLPPKHDVLGRPMKNFDRIGLDFVSPFVVGTDDPDPVVQAFAQMKMNYRMPDRDIAGVQLDTEQYSYLTRTRGEAIYNQLSEWVVTGEWNDLTRTQRINLARKWMTTATRNAEEAVLAKWPALGLGVEARVLEARALNSGDIE